MSVEFAALTVAGPLSLREPQAESQRWLVSAVKA